MIKGKRIESEGIGFAEWNLPARQIFDDAIHETINQMIAQGIEIATKDYECWAYLRDKDTVVVTLPLGEHEGEGPQWTFSLTELIAWEIECQSTTEKKIPPGDEREHVESVKASLIKLIGLIDEALAR